MPTLDQSFTTTGDDSSTLRGLSSNHYLAQQFTPATGGVVSEVDLNLYKSGTVTGNIWVEIWSDNGSNLPSAKIGGSSGNIDVSTLTTDVAGTYQTFTWVSTKPSIVSGTKYWIVFSGDYSLSSSNNAHITGKDAGGYSGGIAAKSDDGSTWSTVSAPADYNFKEYWDVGSSPSASISPSSSASPSVSPSASVSPSSSSSASKSPSASVSPSSSISPSASVSSSPSRSVSPSSSVSPSASMSSSASVSLSISPSSSESRSPSPSHSSSLSPSASISSSVSPSISSSTSLSNSPSVSPSPAASENVYTREDRASLPTDKNDLAVLYTTIEEGKVSMDDGVRVGVTGIGPSYLMHQFKHLHTNRTDRIKFKVNLQSSVAPSSFPVYLQIWNGQTNSWQTVDSDNDQSAGEDFTLFGDVSDTAYYDFHNEVAIRVYQQIPS